VRGKGNLLATEEREHIIGLEGGLTPLIFWSIQNSCTSTGERYTGREEKRLFQKQFPGGRGPNPAGGRGIGGRLTEANLWENTTGKNDAKEESGNKKKKSTIQTHISEDMSDVRGEE